MIYFILPALSNNYSDYLQTEYGIAALVTIPRYQYLANHFAADQHAYRSDLSPSALLRNANVDKYKKYQGRKN
jgi:hypothetical protein